MKNTPCPKAVVDRRHYNTKREIEREHQIKYIINNLHETRDIKSKQ